jgi:hypothetical protein
MEVVSVESARRWLKLAERRRTQFVEMYRSGRWTRHYDEEGFRTQMLAVIADVERWEKVLGTFTRH